MKKRNNETCLPRLLVISHTSFTKCDAMGSTMASYLAEYPPSSVAQFYIKEMMPDIPVCEHYYRVTDREILNSFLHPLSKRSIGRSFRSFDVAENGSISRTAPMDNLGEYSHRDMTMLARKLLWKTNIWKTKEFKAWLDEFDPDVVLVQPGDFSYILNLAVEISKKRAIPLIVHQSESYYLKKYEKNTLVYRLFRADFKRSYERLMKRASYCVYLCEALEEDYKKVFDIQSSTIMKATEIVPEHTARKFDKDNLRFVYGGNLGDKVGRCEPLLEMGQALKLLGYAIDVYTASSGDHMKELTEENGIRLHPAVPKETLVKIMKDSDFVINIENQSPEHVDDLRYAFSTKIADMLACGACSIAYGSLEEADIRYFEAHQSGCVIERKEELLPKLRELIENDEVRERYISNALETARNNHDPVRNATRMKDIICDVWEKANT